MQTMLTTAGMPPRDAFDYWHDIFSAKILKHESEPLDRNCFSATLKIGELGDLSLLVHCMGAMQGSYGGIDDDHLLLTLPQGILIGFADRAITLYGHHLILVDTREPHSGRAAKPGQMIMVRVPRKLLGQRVPITKEVFFRPLPIQSDAALLANFVRMIVTGGPSTLSPAARVIACEHTLDLIALVLGNLSGLTPEFSSPERIVKVKLRTAIESRLTDLSADRASIAADVGFSTQYINRLLKREGTSITELFRRRRLAKCREVIEQSDRPINDIAREFGWTLSANFARDFKRELGLAPREARQLIHKKQSRWKFK
jgi:AraC family transcriptional regulator, positive regulator of tynA and feaB